MSSCIFLGGKDADLNHQAVEFALKFMDVKATLDDKTDYVEEELAAFKSDYIWSFLHPKILRGPLLTSTSVNFHPAPPEYPGIGSASLALFHEEKTYGATAHLIIRKVDAGPILKVNRFEIEKNEGCADLFRRGQLACLSLFKEIVEFVYRYKRLPEPSGETWERDAFTRKDFDDWLILDQTRLKEFDKKIKAARHPKFPGPYLYVYGHKFGLVS